MVGTARKGGTSPISLCGWKNTEASVKEKSQRSGSGSDFAPSLQNHATMQVIGTFYG